MRKSPRDPQDRPVRRTLGLLLVLLLALGVAPGGTPAAAAAPAAPAAVTAPSAPALTSRSRSALALHWPAVPGAASYQARVSVRSSMGGARVVATTEPSAEVTGLRTYRRYYVQVRALDASGTASAWSQKKSWYTLRRSGFAVLPPAGLTAEARGSTSLRVSFAPRAGAAKYLITYGRSATASRVDRHVVSTSPVILPGLESSTTYHLRIRALSASGRAISYYSDHFTRRPLAATTGAPWSPVAGAVRSQVLRVASYNIKCAGCEAAGEEPWEERRGAVLDAIDEQRPDVLGLQEASQASLPGTTLNQYDDLVARLGDPYRLVNAYRYNCATSTSSQDCSSLDRGASESVRIVYNADNVEVLASGSLKLAAVSSRDNERYLAWARLRHVATGRVFVFATTHLQPNRGGSSTEYVKEYYDLRARQARQIRDELDRVAGADPVVLTGDMNSRYNSPGPSGTESNPQYEIFTAAGFVDPLRGGTRADRAKGPVPSLTSLVDVQYNSCNSYVRTAPVTRPQGNNIDYIYLAGALTATAWETAVDVDADGRFVGVIPSDHNLIRADVRFG